jgi:6-pyruvoyltetrahydropterin/6-carboxytetrahydropterin synthase
MEIFKEFTLESAHRLPHVPPEHKCARIHGHSFRLEIWVAGEVDPAKGWLIDFAEIDDAMAPLHDALDHHYLNEVEGLENPTSETLAAWLWQRLLPQLPLISKVVIKETCDTGCVYSGPAS